MKTARFPYIAIRCPYTHETVMVKEQEIEPNVWSWTYKGRPYDSLDDVIESRSKRFQKKS